jgi:UPF0716 protein FxsA
MGRLVLVLFLAWPIAELYVAVLVAQQVGAAATMVLLLGLSALGVWVLRTNGRAWRTVAAEAAPAAGAGLPPSGTGAAAADAGFRLLAGLLLLVPGFLSAACGLVLLFPPVRSLAIAATGNWMVRRFPTLRATMTHIRIVGAGGDVVAGQVVEPDEGEDGPTDGRMPPELH